MNWITVTWPMVAGACFMLGLIELQIGLAHPPRAARFLLSLSSVAMAASSALELALMRADTVAGAVVLLQALNGVIGVILIALTAFVWVYFGTGNKTLALTAPALFGLGFSVNLVPGLDMTYRSVIGLRTVKTLGGASFNVIEGVPNPWNAWAYLGGLALIAYVVDASVKLWRRGSRRRALVVGGSIAAFTLIVIILTALLELGIIRTPYLFSWAYVVILAAMATELNADVLASVRLARELRESERRVDLASAAAELGMWAWDIVHDSIWATGRARALFGFSESEPISFARFQSKLYPEDRAAVALAIEKAVALDRAYEAEYRVLDPDGRTRWVSARGQVERDGAGKPILMRGVVLDISARRDADMELQQLRSQLAHASRVSTMGQLASALAHELSQPLGAILRNVEAAELFLQHDPPDLEELRAILADVRQDDQRAGGVIERLRALLKRRSLDPRPLAGC